MKNIISLYLLVFPFIIASIKAQDYAFDLLIEEPPALQLEADFVNHGVNELLFGDIDGDGDEDAISVSVWNSGYAVVYIADGLGNFHDEYRGDLPSLNTGSGDIGDIDGDGDLDLLLSGSHNTMLYTNDGNGFFTEVLGDSLEDVYEGKVKMVDLDGDNDLDLVINGDNQSNNFVTKIYMNNGLGIFTEDTATNLNSLDKGDYEFADLDGDNDLDMVFSGKEDGWKMTKVFFNNGSGHFDSTSTTNLTAVFGENVDIGDIDGDGDQDFIVSGNVFGSEWSTELYINSGTGTFSSVSGSSITNMVGEVRFFDIDGDADLDIFLSGFLGDSVIVYRTEIYNNDGLGNFSLETDSIFPDAAYSTMAFNDVNGDGSLDVFFSGWLDNSIDDFSTLFINDGTGQFSPILNSPFLGMKYSSAALMDFDGDSDLDLLETGLSIGFNASTGCLYSNDQNEFTEVENTNFIGLFGGDMEVADFDNDGDNDVVVCGRTFPLVGSIFVTNLFLNNGVGVFSLPTSNMDLDSVENGDISIADVDGDNDIDILITGKHHYFDFYFGHLYKNNGSGGFTAVSQQFDLNFESVSDFGDVDNDGDQDLIIVERFTTYLYTNNGSGYFSLIDSTTFMGLEDATVDFEDIDGDNDLDVLITGKNNTLKYTKLYKNNGLGVFTEMMNTPFLDLDKGVVAFGDIDGDDDLDLYISGDTANTFGVYNPFKSGLYLNDGLGNYTELEGMKLATLKNGDALFKDVDGDGLDDLFLTGAGHHYRFVSNLYFNKFCGTYGTLNDTSVLGYVSPSGNAVWDSTGIYMDTIPNNAGCDSILTINLTIVPANIVVQQFGNMLLVEQNDGLYQWLDCNDDYAVIPNETNQEFEPSENGSYCVAITMNGVVDTSACFDVNFVGLEEIDFGSEIEIYPNPTNSLFNIELNKAYANLELIIYNVQGQEIERKYFTDTDRMVIDLQGEDGMYIGELRNELNETFKFSIIKDGF